MAAPGVLVAAAGSGLGCDKDEEYCPGLEPFFFDEAEAVAGHERWMRREQERAQKEEQRVRAANANISAREKILDDDPKQDGRYFNRFYLADFSTFDIDEESPLPPMRYTARVCDNNKRWKIGGVNILSVNIASLDVDFPIDVYGTVIARDGVDYKCIYLFRREKEHCQLIKSEDESLILTGPKRGLELLGDAFIEIDLKINDHLGQEEKQLSKGLLTIRGIAGRNMDKCIVESKDLSTRLSTVKVMYAIVNDAVEATIAIEVIEGEFYGKITAITTGVPNHLVLHDSEVAGAMNGNGKGVIQLLRSVVSVSLEGCLLLTFVDQTGNLKSLGLTPGLNGRVEAGTTVGLTKMLVKVVWSVISI